MKTVINKQLNQVLVGVKQDAANLVILEDNVGNYVIFGKEEATKTVNFLTKYFELA